MATNKRIYYAILAAGIAQDGTSTFQPIHGLLTLGMNTRFNLEQTFEIGQLAVYENIENIPDIEVTVEKYLDGWPLIYHLATLGSTSATLAGRSTAKASLAVSIYPDTNDAASGNPYTQVTCSGLFCSQISYQVQTEGTAKEVVTLVGNNKTWLTTGFTFTPTVFGSDAPYQTGVTNRRQHVVYQPIIPNGTGTVFQNAYTKIPTDIPGISSSGTNDYASNEFGAHLQSIRISANLGRDELLELGRRGPYHRFVNFPVEVRTDYDVISLKGDLMTATENGTLANNKNVGNQTITLKMQEGLYVNCGTRNLCESVNFSGANAGAQGGNAIMTFSYLTFNDFTVLHPMDPAGLTA